MNAQTLHWTDTRTLSVERASTAGDKKLSLDFGTPMIDDIEIVEDQEKIYWLQAYPQLIRRANLDFTEAEDIITFGGANRASIGFDIDRKARKIYWNSYSANSTGLHRSNLDGSQIESIPIPQADRDAGESSRRIVGKVALDTQNQKIYFAMRVSYFYETGLRTKNQIYRVNYNGSEPELMQNSFQGNSIRSLDVDPVNEKLYYSTDTLFSGHYFDEVYVSSLEPLSSQKKMYTGFYNKIRDIAVNPEEDIVCVGLYYEYPDFSAGVFRIENSVRCYRSSNGRFSHSYKVPLNGFTPPSAIAFKSNNELFFSEARFDYSRLDFRIAKASYELEGGYEQDFEYIKDQSIRAPRGLTFDEDNRRVYWADSHFKRLMSSTSTGADISILVDGLNNPDGVAFDTKDSFIYWSERSLGEIHRIKPDGTSHSVFVTGLDSPRMLAIDKGNEELYWTDSGAGKIQKAALDSGAVTDIATSLASPFDLAIDESNSLLFWTETGTGEVRRSNLSGGAATTLYSGQSTLTGLAVNPRTGRLFWSTNGGGKLYSGSIHGGPDAPVELLETSTKAIYDLLLPTFDYGELEVRGNGKLITRNSNLIFYQSGQQLETGSIDIASEVTFELHNTGSGALTIFPESTFFSGELGPDISLVSAPSSAIPPGGTGELVLAFTPSQSRYGEAFVNLRSDAESGSSFSFKLRGGSSSGRPVIFPKAPPINFFETPTIDPASSPSVADGRDFGSVIVGQKKTHTFSIGNFASATLLLQGTPAISVVGAQASWFKVEQQPANTAIHSTSSEEVFTVSFEPPTRISTASASLSIDYNRGGEDEPLVVSLTGSSTAPQIDVRFDNLSVSSSQTHSFGQQRSEGTSEAKTFTIHNTGNAPLNISDVSISPSDQFRITKAPANQIAPGSSSTLEVVFAPKTPGPMTAQIIIQSDSLVSASKTISLSGVATAPKVDIRYEGSSISSSGVYSFTNLKYGATSAAKTFTIHNIGDAPLVINDESINSDQFQITKKPASTIAPRATSTLEVIFSPDTIGTKTGQISVLSNSFTDSTKIISLSGIAISPKIEVYRGSSLISNNSSSTSSSNGTDYGEVGVRGGIEARQFTIRNSTEVPLVFPNGAFSIQGGSDFTFTSTLPSSVSPGGQATFEVSFDPSDVEDRTAEIVIQSDDVNTPIYRYAVSGFGTLPPPDISVSRNGTVEIVSGTSCSSENSGIKTEANIGESSRMEFTLSNVGVEPLEFNGVPRVKLSGTAAGDFTVSLQPAEASLSENSNTAFTVNFTPSTRGERIASVEISSNDPDEPIFRFDLCATARASRAEISGNSQPIPHSSTAVYIANKTDFGKVRIDTATEATVFTITNTGNRELSFSSPAVRIEDVSTTVESGFSVRKQASSIAENSSDTFELVFQPSSEGLHRAKVVVSSNDVDTPNYEFFIQGQGIQPELALKYGDIEIESGSEASEIKGTSFPSTRLAGDSRTQNFYIENLGSGPLTLTGDNPVTIQGTHAADFEVSFPETRVLQASERLMFSITYLASELGLRNATLQIESDDDDESNFSVAIQGNGISPSLSIERGTMTIQAGDDTPNEEDGTYFGAASLDTTELREVFTIRNLGTAKLHLATTPIRLIETESEGFTLVHPDSLQLDVGDAVDFEVIFETSFLGRSSAEICVDSDDLNNPEYCFLVEAVVRDDDSSAGGATPEDTDGDGTTNEEELENGTDPEDSGSNLEEVSASQCVGWNSFLELSQVLEARNVAEESLIIKVSLRNRFFEESSSTVMQLSAQTQQDIIVNDLPGYQAESYGLVCVELFQGSPEGLKIKSQIYRLKNESFDLSYTLSAQKPLVGIQYLNFNNFTPPSSDEIEGLSWIEIVSYSEAAESGTLEFYNLDGERIKTENIQLAPRQRLDLFTGVAGSNQAGLVRWRPKSRSATFHISQSRYYRKASGEIFAATNIPAERATGQMLTVGTSSSTPLTIIEISNVRSFPVQVELIKRDSDGVGTTSKFFVPPKASRHVINWTSNGSTVGSVSIQAARKESLTVTSFLYNYDEANFRSVSGLRVPEALRIKRSTNYNTFLGQNCELVISNASSAENTFEQKVVGSDGSAILSSLIEPFEAFETRAIEICSNEKQNSYGQILLRSLTGGRFVARMQRSNHGGTYTFSDGLME